MRRSLSQLICDDLAELANLESDYIASEEAIRVMAALYNHRERLNIRLIHKSNFLAFLKEKMADSEFIEQPGHYQFLIEVGERSKLKQRTPDTIHYCAVDLFIRPGKAPLAFVADHYRRHGGYYSEFGVIAEKLGIRFAVVGGGVYQADSVHCPIFSIQHLLLTAADPTLLSMLENLINVSTDAVTYLNWEQLTPMYMVYSQSVSTLFNYVDKVKQREGTPKEVDSTLLTTSRFSEYLRGTLSPMVKGTDKGKLRNKAIKYLTASHAGVAVTALEDTFTGPDTAALIDICYAERYPLVQQLLVTALKVEKAYPFETVNGLDTSHPLFELAFYHAHIMENLLKNKEVNRIFNNQALLVLMQKGLIDPVALFAALTIEAHGLELNKAACRTVESNLTLLQAIVDNNLDESFEITSPSLIKLLTAGKTKSFFQNQILSSLFEKGVIALDLLGAIFPYQIDKVVFTAVEGDGAKIEYLRKKFMPIAVVEEGNKASTKEPDVFEGGIVFHLGNDEEDAVTMGVDELSEVTVGMYEVLAVNDDPLTVSDSVEVSEEFGEDDLFAVPEVEGIVLDPALSTKPKVNVGLLVQSMSKSVFTLPPTKDSPGVDTVQKEGVAVFQ